MTGLAAGASDPYTLAAAHSRAVTRLAAAGHVTDTAFNALAQQPFSRQHMHALLCSAPEQPLAARLRRLRRDCLLALIGRDLSGRADLAEVTATMTQLAEVCTQAACAELAGEFAASYGTPIGEDSGEPQSLMVVGMGKLGGGELNVSSDIDLVFIYPEEGETRGPRTISNHEYFVRFGRRLIGLLNDLTPEGFVFRVDMRLRPYGDSGPLVCSLPALENYFIEQGREWERYAWLKGRLIALAPTVQEGQDPVAPGPPPEAELQAAERALAAIVQPFVFRRYLDFSTIASMRELSEQIRREVRRRDMSGNIKLGSGGIRQIEFIAQLFQLIRGGREPALRTRPTLQALRELCARGYLEAEETDALARDYDLLRRLEHRLQYLDDAQTHDLPLDPDDCARIAHSMGCADWSQFSLQLEALRARVSAQFERVCAISPGGEAKHALAPLWNGELGAAEAERALAQAGFREPAQAAARIEALRTSPGVRRMGAGGQARLAALVPRALEAAGRSADPEATLARLLEIIESIGRRESYLALLVEHPPVLDRLAQLAVASPWASGYLARHPILLDELLDVRTLHAPPAWPRLLEELRHHLDDTTGNAERQLDILRQFKHTQLFRIVAQDLAGDLLLEVVSDRLSELADLLLTETLARCWRHLNREQTTPPPPRFAIIGYGKLGGKELGYGSDLDLAFVYDDTPLPILPGNPQPPSPAEDGGAGERYARLGLRLNSWLSTMTAAGVLYATDMRLRPDGDSGLLVPSIAAFEQYQRHKAWVWEHQALTRARAIAGDPALCARFERLRQEILRRERELAPLRAQICEMRQRMRESKPPSRDPDLFDIKHGAGGLVDLEFIVQFIVLAHAAHVRALTGNIGNLALLNVAARAGLIDAGLAAAAQAGYRNLRRTQHAMQLSGHDPARAQAAVCRDDARAIHALWESVLGAS